MGRATGRGLAHKIAVSKGVYTPRPRKEVACGQRRYQPRRRRAGAGAKKKPLADKIAEGNPGRRKLTVIDFQDTADLEGQPMPKPSAMLSATQKDGKTLVAAEVYEKTWTWLAERGCAALVSPQLLERYAMSVAAGYSVRRRSPSTVSSPNTPPRGTRFKVPMWR